jgi:hypothetical protein
MKIQNALSLVLAAGVVAPAMADNGRDVQISPREVHQATRMGNVYINAQTNERVITLRGDLQRPAARGAFEPLELWVMDNFVPCNQFDPAWEGAFVTSLDDPAAPPLGVSYLDWGDVGANTVVDGFLFSWASQEPVANEGDGVPGLDGVITFFDGDNGGDTCERLALLALTVGDLPGNSGQFTFEVYDITIDLNGLAVMELGDTDANDQGTGLYNELSFIDLDGDGLHDWSYAIRTVQPNPATPIETLVLLAAPRGEFGTLTDYAVDQSFPDGTPTATAGTAGAEDAFDLFDPAVDPSVDALGVNVGTFFFGGLTCDDDGDGSFNGTAADLNPFAGFSFALYGPAGVAIDGGPQPCPADFNGDGVANFNDIAGFLGAFNSQLPTADFNGDGNINFNDIAGFLGAFNAGCP